jgi:tetratricopeptide (TPR) repeat protein
MSMPDHPVLFLSHSNLDTETARELKRRLLASPEAQAAGLEIWFDKDDLLPGQGWQEQLEKVIATGSTAFAVIVGTRGVVNWVDREVRVALSRATEQKNYPFIPVLASPSLSSSLPPFARQFQGVNDPIKNEIELGKLLRTVLDSGRGDRHGIGRQRPVKLIDSPFVGLRAMTEADADRFFGREAELDALVETVRAYRLVAIVADSGSGKSSLAQAGLIPRIRGGALEDKSRVTPDERTWQVVVTRPGTDPVENLRIGITDAAERLGLAADARAALRRRVDPATRAEWVYALQCNLPVKATETVLIIDQFEELLTQTPLAKRESFIDWLMEITAESAAIPVRVVLTIRADYFNLCSPYAALYERIKLSGGKRSPHFRLKALTAAGADSGTSFEAGSNTYSGLAAIVHRPLILAGHTNQVERNALLAAVRRDVSDRPGDLALVQMALHETWRESKVNRENLMEAYGRVGGVAGALAHAAEEVRTNKLTQEEATLLEPVLVRLVNLGETGGATRRVGRRDEFNPALRSLAEKLTTEDFRRLLLAGSETIEICHEQLITQWPWWQNRLSAAASDMHRLARLIQRAEEWSSQGRQRRHLATRAELDLFREIARQRRPWLSQTEVGFVEASARWAGTRLGGIAGAALGVLVAVTFLSALALQSRNQALRAADDSMMAAGGMVVQAASLDDQSDPPAQVRRGIVGRGCDLVDRFRAEAVSQPQISELVMCRLERAHQRERMHEYDEARRQFGEAIALATQRHTQLPRIDAALSLTEARRAYAEYYLRQKDSSNAEVEFEKLLEEARSLAKIHQQAALMRPQAEALGQLGDIHAERGDSRGAAASYDSAADVIQEILGAVRINLPDPGTIAWLMRLRRLAGQQYMRLGDVDQAGERYHQSLAAAGHHQLLPEIEIETAETQAALFTLERVRGNAVAAETARTEALSRINWIVESLEASSDLKQQAAGLKAWIETYK